MSSNPASATLLQEARAEFEQLVAMITSSEASTATLDRMERSIFRRVLHLGLQLLQLFIATRVEAEAHGVHPGVNGRALPYHSQQPASYFSVFGKVTFRRAYFYRGGQSCCPLDTALSLPARCYSDFLMELAGELAVDGVFERALEMLGKFLSLELPKLALETWVREESALVTAFYDQKAAFPANSEGQILVAQADGKGVPMVRSATVTAQVRRGKGTPKTRKKEAIATALYTIEPFPRTSASIVEALFSSEAEAARPSPKRPSPCHKQVFATMNGKTWALERLQERVHQRDGRHIRVRVALTDGAQALQQRIQEKLPDFTLVLDIIHVIEYLWKAGNALYGETDPQRTKWVKAQVLDLLSSRTDQVIRRLEDKAGTLRKTSQACKVLHQVASYFRRNQAYMDYATYLRRGWPIGTGVIEGVCRHVVKDRMELSGMRWTVPGADALLALRAIHENGDWDEFHAFRRARCHEDLYGAPLPDTWVDQTEHLDIKAF
jgi:hypothetical protein